ncbi:MAG: hypothetical protein ACLP9L_19650 [Thermoguttaceae bacterium]
MANASIIGVASKAATYFGEIADLTVEFPDVAGRTALDGSIEDVAACSSQQEANTAVVVGRPRIVPGDMATAQVRSGELDLDTTIASDTMIKLEERGVERGTAAWAGYGHFATPP